jgi:hypothetical protein
MHINFSLTPLELVQPWGNPDRQSLHWFGLTHGQYWIEVGTAVLFEYSTAVQERFGTPRYCDYQVSRLHEDLLEMVPAGWHRLAVLGLPGSQRDEKFTHFQTFQLPVTSSPREAQSSQPGAPGGLHNMSLCQWVP